VLAVVGFLFYFRAQVNSRSSNQQKAEVEISSGESSLQVSDAIRESGLARSAWSFELYLKFKRISVKPGDYLMPANLTEIQVANILSSGSHQVNWITIKDGWRREQVAAYLSEDLGLSSDEFLAKSQNLEGELTLDTYKLSDQPTVDEVISKMTADYQTKTAGLNVTEDDLTLASIIQKEAGPESDMPAVAAVFDNRIKIGMKLQSDVTAIYQKDSENWQSVGLFNYKFWQQLSSGDIENYPGPYNTYSVAGLPPTPICSPSMAAINSVLHPATSDYLYFIYGSDGNLYLAKTAAEQQANINKYL
jgi:UPF0755 protein